MVACKNYKTIVLYSFLFVLSLAVSVLNDQPVYLLLPFFILAAQKIFQLAIVSTITIFLFGIVCLPLSIEWQVTSTLSLDFPTEPILIFLTFLGVCKWILKPSTFPTELLKSNLFFLMLLHAIWLMLNIFFSSHKLLSFKFLLAKLWYIIPSIILLQCFEFNRIHIIKVVRLIILVMLFVVFQSLARHAFEGFSFEGIKYSLTPFFRNHVNYSATLVLLFPWLLYLKPFASSNKKQSKFSIQNLVVIIYGLGLFFAFSRGAWLALVLGLFVGFAIVYNKLKLIVFSSLIILLITIGVILSKNKFLELAPNFNTTIYHNNLYEHLNATVTLSDVSNAERLYRWVAAFNMINKHPFVGFGTNTFYYHYKQYTINAFRTWVSENDDHSTVHNYFLLALIEQGIVGFCLLLGLIFTAIFKIQHLYNKATHRNDKLLLKAIGVSFVMICVLNFLSDLIETDKVGFLFWLLLGILIRIERNTKCIY